MAPKRKSQLGCAQNTRPKKKQKRNTNAAVESSNLDHDKSNNKKARTTILSLPAELKNRIYDLVLVSNFEINIRDEQNKVDRGKRLAIPRSAPWSEPALLQVCKEIRKQALPLYYGSNAFIISVHMEDFTSAAAWLRSIIATTDNPTTFLWLLFVIQSTAWTKLAHFKPLVLLIRDIGPNLMRQKFWDVEASNLPADPQPPAFELCHNTGQYIRAALTEMVDLGTKAHEEEWNDAYLDWEFMVLTEKHLATKGGQAAMCNERGKARMKRAHRRQAAAAAAVAIQE